MKAAILRAHGEADQIELGDWPDPVAGPGDVVIDVRAASLNRRDWWIMRNPARGAAPCILGSDAGGVVRAVGDGVTRCAPGDEVLLYPALGWGDRDDAPTDDFEIFGIPRRRRVPPSRRSGAVRENRAGGQLTRRLRKAPRISAASTSGCSTAGKCPPLPNSVHRAIRNWRSA
jgi:NADPH:quinone reductase-like Zn-dependent oxidoreductase